MGRCAQVVETWLSEGYVGPGGKQVRTPLGTGEVGCDPWAPDFEWAGEGC